MTDDFTIAAWEEADIADGTTEWDRKVFVLGALWARDHLAAHQPEVTIQREDGKPTTCEVRRNGELIFAGREHSADLRVTPQEPTDAECIHILSVLQTDLGQPTRTDFEWSQAAINRCREAIMSARRGEEKR